MIYETKELVKQLELYADAITGFATVQLIGFMLLMTHGDCFTKNVVDGIWWALPIGAVVNLMYLTLICRCHRGENKALGTSSKAIRSSDPVMWGVRARTIYDRWYGFGRNRGIASRNYVWRCQTPLLYSMQMLRYGRIGFSTGLDLYCGC